MCLQGIALYLLQGLNYSYCLVDSLDLESFWVENYCFLYILDYYWLVCFYFEADRKDYSEALEIADFGFDLYILGLDVETDYLDYNENLREEEAFDGEGLYFSTAVVP